MKVDGSISSLIQGVSQQPARERLPGQGELQENCSSDPVRGLTRRGALNFIRRLLDTPDSWEFQDYDAGSLGHFIIAHKSGDIKLFNLDGTEITVNKDADAIAYLTGEDFTFLGIDDSIYCCDTTKVVQMGTATRSYVQDSSLVFLLGGQYGRKFEITVEWEDSLGATTSQSVSYTTPNGSSAAHINNIATDYIADVLENQFEANTTLFTDFGISRRSDVIFITPRDGADVESFTVSVDDGDGGANMFAVNNQVTDVGELPRYAPHGYYVKVEESGSEADDWYMEFVAEGDNPQLGQEFGTKGVWVETVAPDTPYQLDTSTMPHVLEKVDDTTFTFKRAEWDERGAGNSTSNPDPSFVGNTISDMGAFQGRLVFLSTVNVIMSRTNKHTNFFNNSANGLADDDPIDMSSAIGTYTLEKLVPHNRDLVIFSDSKAQFIVFGRNALTPSNSSLVLTTEFDSDLRADPVAAGVNVFFAYNYGPYLGIREFFTEGSEDINKDRDITQHVSQYILGAPEQLVSTDNFSKLLIRTDQDLKRVYLYEYLWADRRKVQSSFSTWIFSKDVIHMFFVDNLLYVLTKSGDHYELFDLDLDFTEDSGISYRVCLDEKTVVDNVNTTVAVPYDIDDISNYVVVQGTGCPYPGLESPIQSYSSGTITLKSDMGGGSVILGRKYLSRYIPTTPFVRDRNNVKIGSGKLTIKSFVLHVEDTGHVTAKITDRYGYEANVEFSGRILGDPENRIGKPAIVDTAINVPYKKNADTSELEVRSESHLPFSILEMEWVGQWKKRGRRITGG